MNSLFDKPNFKKPFKTIKNFWYSLKLSHERATKGYSSYDLWDIDYWFLTVMPDMLSDFNKNLTSVPQSLIDEVKKENFNITDEEISDLAFKRWKSIIDTISFLFDEIVHSEKFKSEKKHNKRWLDFALKYGALDYMPTEGDAFNPYTMPTKGQLPEFKNAFRIYTDSIGNEEDYREECKNEAFLLFSKWFFHLWQ